MRRYSARCSACFQRRDFDAALELALDSEYALTGGVYSRNPRNIERARRAFRTGNLYINRKTTGAVVGRHPFGGLRAQRRGRQGGRPRLPAAVPRAAHDVGEHDAPRLCAGGHPV